MVPAASPTSAATHSQSVPRSGADSQEHVESGTTVPGLPMDVLENHVFTKLGARELVRCSAASAVWKKAIDAGDLIWDGLAKRSGVKVGLGMSPRQAVLRSPQATANMRRGTPTNCYSLRGAGRLLFSPDGRHIIQEPARAGDKMRLFEVATGTQVALFPGECPAARDIDKNSRRPRLILPGDDAPQTFQSAFVSPDGSKLGFSARRGYTKRLFVVDLQTHETLFTTFDGRTAFFAENGPLVVEDKSSVTVVHPETGELLRVIPFKSRIQEAHAVADGKHLLTLSYGSVVLTDLSTGTTLAELDASGSLDGELLVLSPEKDMAFLWGHTVMDLRTGRTVLSFVGRGVGQPSTDGKSFFLDTDDGHREVWDVTTGTMKEKQDSSMCESEARSDAPGNITVYGDMSEKLAYSEDGRLIFLKNTFGHTAHLDPHHGTIGLNEKIYPPERAGVIGRSASLPHPLEKLAISDEVHSPGIVVTELQRGYDTRLRYSEDAQGVLVSGGKLDAAYLIDMRVGSMTRFGAYEAASWDYVAFSPDNAFIAARSRAPDALSLSDARSGNFCTAIAHPSLARGSGRFSASVEFSVDGHTLVSRGHDCERNDVREAITITTFA